jgi:ligand-binding SRPBCC domain-containing protein
VSADLRFETTLPAPIGEMFAFHADPRSLERLMEGRAGFLLLSPGVSVEPGSVTRVRVVVAGLLPVEMEFLHGPWDPPRMFSERQVRGPFRVFEHRHEFEETAGGTIVRDRIRVGLPPRLGGGAATRLLVVPRLRAEFALRHEALRRIFGAPPAVPRSAGRAGSPSG